MLYQARILKYFKKKEFLVFFIFILAFIPRISVAVFSNQVLAGDEIDYNQLAIRILEGQRYRSDSPFEFTNIRPPLYPLFIAIIYFLTNYSILAVRLMQAVLSGFTCIIVFFIAENLFKNKRISFSAGIICALYPLFISFSRYLLSETLFIFLLALAIIFLLKDYDCPNLKNKFFAGLFLGLSALTRSVILAFVPFLILWLFFFSSEDVLSRLKTTAVIMLFMILTIMPWTIRNYVVFKRFIFINTSLGITFYHYSNENTLAKIFNPEVFLGDMPLSEKQKNEILLLPEPVRDRYFYGLGWKFALSHPKEFLKIRLISLGKFWHLWPQTPAKYKEYCMKNGTNKSSLLYKFADTYFLYFAKILYHLPYNILFIGMILGPIKSFKNRLEFRKSFMFILLIVAMSFFYSVHHVGSDRLRMPIDPYVFILGLYSIVSFLDEKMKR